MAQSKSKKRSSSRKRSSGGGSSKSPLGKKLGPFPLWLWVIIGATLAYLYYNRYGGGSVPGGSTQQSTYTPNPMPSYTGPEGNVPLIITPSVTPGKRRHRGGHHHHHHKRPRAHIQARRQARKHRGGHKINHQHTGGKHHHG